MLNKNGANPTDETNETLGAQADVELEKIKDMQRLGEIDADIFEDEEEQQEPETEEQQETDSIEVDGKKLTLDEVREAIRFKENAKEFNRSNTRKAQEVAEEKKKLSALAEKLEKMRAEVKGDDVLEKNVELIESLAKEVEAIRGDTELERLERQEKADREYVTRRISELEKAYDVKIPSVDSNEFKAMVQVGMQSDPLELGVLKMLLKDKNKAVLKPQRVVTEEPNSGDSGYENTMKLADKLGVDRKRLKRFM